MKHKAIIFGCAILYALTTLVLVTAMTLNVSRTQAATVPQQNMFFHQSFPDIVVAPNTTTGFDQISFTADQKGQALIVIDMNAMLDNYHGSYSPTPITTLFCRLIASSVTPYIVTKTYTWHDSNDESFDLTGTFPVQAGGNSVILNCSVSQALSNTSITLTSGGTSLWVRVPAINGMITPTPTNTPTPPALSPTPSPTAATTPTASPIVP